MPVCFGNSSTLAELLSDRVRLARRGRQRPGFGSCADAVSAATRYDPDLMIVDAGLGRGSGVSAVEEILRAGPLAHVFISGDAGRVRVRKPDAVVVRKPFGEAELARAIDLALAAAFPPKSERLCGSRDGH